MEEVDDATKRARARVGTRLHEKWMIDGLLGVGGMASVYSATHRNGKRAALKVLHPELLVNSGLRTRFLREGYVANKVAHPGAVSILDDDVAADGSVFLVMEMLEGATVDRHIEVLRTIPPAETLLLADRLLDVMVAAHSKDIVHRDLKPANLFVTDAGELKVLDFGIARLRDATSGAAATTSASMGTPGFMPPEQARGRHDEVDARSDIWAIGATLFTMLAYRYVHEAKTVNEQLLAGMTKPAPKLAEVMPDAPPALCRIVDRALEFKKEDRYATASEMQLDVREAYREITGCLVEPTLRLAPLAEMPVSSVVVGDAATLAATSFGGTRPPERPSQAIITKKPSRGLLVGLAVVASVATITGVVWRRSAESIEPAPHVPATGALASATATAVTPSPVEVAVTPPPIPAPVAEPQTSAMPQPKAVIGKKQVPSAVVSAVSVAPPPPPPPPPPPSPAGSSSDMFLRRK